ncbi:MAG: hypothetical protein ACRDWI_15365 [Jiangellaceae bacterium]
MPSGAAGGKSDPIDAYQAAHAVPSGRATSAAQTETIEGVRAPCARHAARRSGPAPQRRTRSTNS